MDVLSNYTQRLTDNLTAKETKRFFFVVLEDCCGIRFWHGLQIRAIEGFASRYAALLEVTVFGLLKSRHVGRQFEWFCV